MSRGGWRRPVQRGPAVDVDLNLSFSEIPLYPPLDLPTPVLPNEQEERQLALASELLSLFKSSPYYLADKIEKPSIERYSDRYKTFKASVEKSLQTGQTDLSFFPEELHCVKDPSKQMKTRMAKKQLDLSLLERLEKQDTKGKDSSGVVEEDDEQVIVPEQYEEEAEEEDNDYLIQYDDDDYDAAGNDSDGGGGDEY